MSFNIAIIQRSSPPAGRLVQQSPTPGQWRQPRPVVSSPSLSGSRWPAWPRGGEWPGSLHRTSHDCGHRAWHASAWCRSWESRQWRWGVCLQGSVQSELNSDWMNPGWAPSNGNDGFWGGTLSHSCPGRAGRQNRGARSQAGGSTCWSSLLLGVFGSQTQHIAIFSPSGRGWGK